MNGDALYKIQADIHANQTAVVTLMNAMKLGMQGDEFENFFKNMMREAINTHPNIANPDFPEEYKSMLKESLKQFATT